MTFASRPYNKRRCRSTVMGVRLTPWEFVPMQSNSYLSLCGKSPGLPFVLPCAPHRGHRLFLKRTKQSPRQKGWCPRPKRGNSGQSSPDPQHNDCLCPRPKRRSSPACGLQKEAIHRSLHRKTVCSGHVRALSNLYRLISTATGHS